MLFFVIFIIQFHFVLIDDLSPAKANRIAAIRETAAALRERLAMESKRLTEMVQNKNVQQKLFLSTALSPQHKKKVKIPKETPTSASYFPGTVFSLLIVKYTR